MPGSILVDIKRGLGVAEDYEPFDDEIITHINAALMLTATLGLPDFTVTGKTETWNEWLGADAPNLQAVKSYVILRVKLLFDPPANSFLTNAIEKQIEEFGWRINLVKETAT